jgi:prepilin signal peptidase PulO-like enzyme (type II secretory pathway)
MDLVLAGFIGIISGLLINYLADVLPQTRRLSTPLWWPVSGEGLVDYLKTPRVAVVLAISIAAALALCTYLPQDFSIYSLALILIYFALVAVIDIEHRHVLHPVSIVGAVALGAIGFIRHGFVPTALGAMAGFGAMLAFYYLGEWLGRLMARGRGEKWQETALGFGDVNLGGVIGLLMGWPGVVAALTLGILAAGVYSAIFIVISMLTGRFRAFASIPYAPFLCFGAVATVLLGIYGGI